MKQDKKYIPPKVVLPKKPIPIPVDEEARKKSMMGQKEFKKQETARKLQEANKDRYPD